MDFAKGGGILVLLLVGLVALVLWSAFSRMLERWRVPGPILMVVVGIGLGVAMGQDIGEQLNTAEAERIVELVLAILLFLDASEVRGGFFAGERGIVARLLAIAFPLSLALAFVLGFPLLSWSSWPVLLAVACVVMPVDFAPAVSLLRTRSVRRGVRHAVAVESGYNDGIVSPLFALALLLLAGSGSAADATATSVAEVAVLGAAVAILVGGAVGVLAALLVRVATARRWAGTAGARITMLIVPILTYEVASHLEGNGFIAAFLAGLAYRLVRTPRHTAGHEPVRHDIAHEELTSVEDIGTVLSMLMWLVLGVVVVLAVDTGIEWSWIAYGVLALTLARLVPVWLATLGSALTWRERTMLGLFGPRGTSSIVFGLLAYNAMREDDANMVLYVTVVVVLLSLVGHGVVLPAILSRTRTDAAPD